MMPSGAFDESRAPTYTAGSAPIRIDVVRPSSKSPTSMCAIAADVTSGTACTRSVPTNCAPRSWGYVSIRQTMMIEPDPTDVSPTSMPPIAPIRIVSGMRTWIASSVPSVSRRPARASALRRPWSHALKTMATAASVSVTPRKILVVFSMVALSPDEWRTKTPANAAGIEPTHSHRTSSHRTVRRRT